MNFIVVVHTIWVQHRPTCTRGCAGSARCSGRTAGSPDRCEAADLGHCALLRLWADECVFGLALSVQEKGYSTYPMWHGVDTTDNTTHGRPIAADATNGNPRARATAFLLEDVALVSACTEP